MKYYRLLFLCLIFCCSPLTGVQSEAVYPEGYWEQKYRAQIKLKKEATKDGQPPLEPNQSLGLIKVAFYLTAGVGIVLLLAVNIPLLFNTILLFPWLWLAGLIWILSSILAMLGVIMILANAPIFDFVSNQNVAAYLLALLLLRIIILVGLGSLIGGTMAIAILLISAMPAFIAYFIGIRRSLKYHKTRKEAEKFWHQKQTD